ncbi:hypothetical protein CPB83DRAFT_334293 [Crepidotus variabilis]|uniref:DUF2423 domain-containing protein n=1 Tax=Crepidotus variabilis TaxID=179855 RepID=A0A9P6ESF3_9AGAR|nr:hypothetical protein CPB83DRAFT_334293 [Crepidotus variabilis]
MAKSLRSKTKRAFRSKKREEGVYAAAAAGRLHRLNSKLLQVTQKDKDGDVVVEEAKEDNTPALELDDSNQNQIEPTNIDANKSNRISTHGTRGSRREEWRKSKGMPVHSSRHGMNRQGGLAAKRKYV